MNHSAARPRRISTPPGVMSPELVEYRRMIERLARDSINSRIPNGRPAHAAILLEVMLRHAKTVVRIYSGELATETYGAWQLTDAAKGFLMKPGTRMRVLLQHAKDQGWVHGHPMINAIETVRDRLAGTLEIRCATGVYATDEAQHFAVMDECGYRFEHDHDGTLAVANFNEPKVATELIPAFDRAFELAQPLMTVPS